MGKNLIPAYEPGTKVRLAKRRKEYEPQAVGINAKMQGWLGKTVTIIRVHRDTNGVPYYIVKENNWLWDNSLIEDTFTEFVCESSEEELTAASFGRFFAHFTVKD